MRLWLLAAVYLLIELGLEAPVTGTETRAQMNTNSSSSGTKPSYGLAILGATISGLWLLNLSAGFIELPDYIPIIGNLDEVFFSGLLFYCLRILGVPLPTPRKTGDVVDGEVR